MAVAELARSGEDDATLRRFERPVGRGAAVASADLSMASDHPAIDAPTASC